MSFRRFVTHSWKSPEVYLPDKPSNPNQLSNHISSIFFLIDGSRSTDIKFPINAVSVVGVPESPEVAKNHGVLVGKQFGDYNSIASHYLQKPDMLQMQEVGAIFRNGNGEKAVYIDTGVVIFTGDAVNSFLSLLDEPIVNICTSKGITPTQSVSIGMRSSSYTSVKALRLELYSDILHACALSGAAKDLNTYLSVLGITSTELEDKPYTSALKVIWNILHSCPLHLIKVPQGKFCHLGTSSELLTLLSCCTDYRSEIENENENENDYEKKTDGNMDQRTLGSRRENNQSKFSIQSDSTDSDEDKNENEDEIRNTYLTIKISKLDVFSKKYSLNNFVMSSILYRENSESYLTINQLNSTNISFSKNFKGIIINSILILNKLNNHQNKNLNEKINENSLASENSLIEHSLLSGNINVGFRSVVSHFPGFLGSNLTVLDGIMMQYVPVKHSNALISEKNEFVVLLFSIDDDVKAHYLEEHSSICGASWRILFDVRTS